MLTLEWVHEHLVVDRNALDDELAIHSQVLFEIGREVASLSARVKEAKRIVDKIEGAEIAAQRKSDPKITVGMAEHAARSTRAYLDAWRELVQVTETHDLWVEARAAWAQKGYALKDLGALFASEYFAIDSIRKPVNMKDVRAAMRERTGDHSKPARRKVGD